MLAVKFFDDHYFPNSYYAKIGGVSTNEINLLEVEFLRFVSFSLYVEPREYQEYLFQICPRDTANEACPRDIAHGISGGASVGSPSPTGMWTKINACYFFCSLSIWQYEGLDAYHLSTC